MVEKISAENSANSRVGYPQIAEVLNDNHRVCCRVGASFQYLQVRQRRMGAEADADEPYGTFHRQVKFSGQRRIDRSDLSACIDQKIVWAGVVDLDRNNHLGASN